MRLHSLTLVFPYSLTSNNKSIEDIEHDAAALKQTGNAMSTSKGKQKTVTLASDDGNSDNAANMDVDFNVDMKDDNKDKDNSSARTKKKMAMKKKWKLCPYQN